MTEKEVAEESESLSDRILHKLISVIPFLLLSSGIAFLLFKYLFYSEGSSALSAFILWFIIIIGIMILIPIIVGHIYEKRWVGCCLAFLIPIVVFMEAMFQFSFWDVDAVFFITFCALVVGMGNYFFVRNILSPLVITNNIKKEDVVCIQIFSRLNVVEKLIDDMLNYLNFFHRKTTISNKEIQWTLGQWKSGRLLHSYYLHAKSDVDNTVCIGFLSFVEGVNELYRVHNQMVLNFVNETIKGYFRSHDIECESTQDKSFSSDLLERALRGYKGASRIEKLKDAKKMLVNYLKSYRYVMIVGILITIMAYVGRQIISGLYTQEPGLFLLIASIISVLVGVFAKDILQFLNVGDKRGRIKVKFL